MSYIESQDKNMADTQSWEIFRGYRNKLLAHSDWTQSADSPLSDSKKVEWKTYDDMRNSIRPYNLEKLDISKRVNKLLSNFSLYSYK